MGAFTDHAGRLNEIMGNPKPWIMWKATSDTDMDDFHRDAESQKDLITDTCELCVAANHCYFFNSPDKTPKLPHPNCRCQSVPISTPNADEIDLDFRPSKVFGYLFTDPDKKGFVESIGYTLSDAPIVYDEIAKQAKQGYVNGDYTIYGHDARGVHITIKYRLQDKKHIGKTAIVKSGWSVRPHGKLMNTTTFSGREIV